MNPTTVKIPKITLRNPSSWEVITDYLSIQDDNLGS